MNPATINQSSRLLTNSLYATEHFNDLDQKERDAMDMDEFHSQIYMKQLEENSKNRQYLEEQSLQAMEDQKMNDEKAQNRSNAEKELEDKYYWDLQKNDWYWGDYNKNINQSSYGNVDNHLDNLNPKTYQNIEISDKPTEIGSYEEGKEGVGSITDKTFTYRAPFREYTYDVENKKLVPNDQRFVTEDNVLNLKNKCIPSDDLQGIFDQKYKEKVETTITESFVSNDLDPKLDAKLMEIYTKTLSPQEDLPKVKTSIFTYSHCLILVIIFFLLFRST